MLLKEMMRDARQEEKTKAKQECILTVLESKFSVPVELKNKIISETDFNKLDIWFQLSLRVPSFEEFKQNM